METVSSPPPEQIEKFFNDLELREDQDDLELLVVAEKRGLINATCQTILREARRRGIIPPREEDEGVLETYDVNYLGAATVETADRSNTISEPSILRSVAKVAKNPRQAFQTPLLMEVHSSVVKVFDVQDTLEHRLSFGSRTLRKLRDATLRRLTSRKRESSDSVKGINKDNAVLVVEHMRREVHSFVSFNKSIACVVREKDYTGKMMFVCHAYRCHSHVKAREIADHLRVSHRSILEKEREARRRQYPIERVSLVCATDDERFGLSLIGPLTHNEALTGVFISSIDPSSPADRDPRVRTKLQIIAINGKNTEESVVSECRELLLASHPMIVIDLQENPIGFGLYEYHAGTLKPKVNFTEGDQKDPLDAATQDLLNFSNSKSFSSIVSA
eukprot:gene1618-4754_t